MNKAVKALWVSALESGEYKQTQGRLERNGTIHGFCCLGVLCDLAVKEGIAERKTSENSLSIFYGEKDPTGELVDFNGGELPHVVRMWAELKHTNPVVSVFDEVNNIPSQTSLAALNDSGKTFSEIAEIIKNQL